MHTGLYNLAMDHAHFMLTSARLSADSLANGQISERDRFSPPSRNTIGAKRT
jgi:hypothetical protein